MPDTRLKKPAEEGGDEGNRRHGCRSPHLVARLGRGPHGVVASWLSCVALNMNTHSEQAPYGLLDTG